MWSCCEGFFPPAEERQVGGRRITVAEADVGGATCSTEWFQHGGVQPIPAIVLGADQDDAFRYDARTHAWQREEVPSGEQMHVDDFADSPGWRDETGAGGLGKPATGPWRSVLRARFTARVTSRCTTRSASSRGRSSHSRVPRVIGHIVRSTAHDPAERTDDISLLQHDVYRPMTAEYSPLPDEFEQVRDLLDRNEIIELTNRFGYTADTRDWTGLRNCFTDTVDVDDASVGGIDERDVPADELVATWEPALGSLDVTQHLLGGHLIDHDGDEATCHAYSQAQHVLERPAEQKITWTLGGRYEFLCVRTSDQWRIRSVTTTAMWDTGDATIFEQAAE